MELSKINVGDMAVYNGSIFARYEYLYTGKVVEKHEESGTVYIVHDGRLHLVECANIKNIKNIAN